MTQVHPSKSSPVPGAMRWGLVGLAVLLAPGCATTKDLDTLRAQLNDQVAVVRSDAAQATLQGLQTESDFHRTILGNLRVDFKEFRVAHEGVAKETDRFRMSVGSLEQGMMHQLQMEVTLARERIKQLEQVIEGLQKSAPAEKSKGGTATPKL